MNGFCDFCGSGGGYLLTVGDEHSVVFYLDDDPAPKVWDGRCPEGSRVYFKRFDSPKIVELIQKSVEVLEEDPIRFEPPYDDPKTRLRKVYISQEVERAKRELLYRLDEG